MHNKAIWLYVYIIHDVYVVYNVYIIYILFHILFHNRSLQDIDYGRLCYTVVLVIYLFYLKQCLSVNPGHYISYRY